MPDDLKTILLDDRGADFLRGRLSELAAYGPALQAFCKAFAAQMQAAAGVVSTTVPAGVSEDQIYAFDSGGILPVDPLTIVSLDGGGSLVPIPSLFGQECARIRDALKRAPERVCIVADPMPRKHDSSIEQGYEETIFYVRDEIFHLITATTSEDAADRALGSAPFWSNLILISARAPTLASDRGVELADLCACAGAAVEATCSAYDGEGSVLWTRA